jgi:ATP-dependent Clp protease ATP-binding subunit ClpA
VSDLGLSSSIQNVIKSAQNLQLKSGDTHISVDHLLLALHEDKDVHQILEENGLTVGKMQTSISQVRGNKKITNDNGEATYEALSKYGTDLVTLAAEGKLDPGSHIIFAVILLLRTLMIFKNSNWTRSRDCQSHSSSVKANKE